MWVWETLVNTSLLRHRRDFKPLLKEVTICDYIISLFEIMTDKFTRLKLQSLYPSHHGKQNSLTMLNHVVPTFFN